jgi:hypothetical protein
MPYAHDFDAPVNANDVETLFQLILGRPVGNEEFKQAEANRDISLKNYITALVSCEEFHINFSHKKRNNFIYNCIDDHLYRIPSNLSSNLDIKNVLFIGSCLMGGWPAILKDYCSSTKFDQIDFNNCSKLPPIDAESAARIDFQILQIPLRAVMPEGMYFNLKYSDDAGFTAFFDAVVENVNQNFHAITEYNERFNVPHLF